MTEKIENKDTVKVLNRSVHMANERTFLAWIRSSIGIMAFGFVVVKFTLFMKQLSIIVEKSTIENTIIPTSGFSAVVGIFLVGLGTLLVLLAFLRYKKLKDKLTQILTILHHYLTYFLHWRYLQPEFSL